MGMSTEAVTTVLAAARSYDLTTLSNARSELSLSAAATADDAWLSRAVSQASKTVMNETNRVFAPELIEDVFYIARTHNHVPAGLWTIQLSRWPVLAVASVVQASYNTATTVTLVENVDFRVDYENGKLIRLDASSGQLIAWAALPVTVRYSAGFGRAVSESATVPGSTPWKITVAQAATFSCDQTVTRASGAVLTRVAANPSVGQYAVAAGVYTFNAADAGAALTFAYATGAAPDDIEEACLRIVIGRYRARGRDPSLIQRDTPGVGTERFWFGNAPGQTGAVPPDIAGLLDNYRIPVAA